MTNKENYNSGKRESNQMFLMQQIMTDEYGGSTKIMGEMDLPKL